jgi:hypothetical protein
MASASSAASAADLPQAFELSALAVVVEVSSTQQPAASVITEGLVDATAGYASSALRDGGSAESIAAPLYPGDLVAGGPQLLCQELFPCPVDPPAYPLAADAAYPTQPDARTPGDAGAATATATARPDATSARAVAVDVDGLPFTWEAGTATTHAWVSPGAAHVRSASVVHDLVIGALHIDLLESSDVVDVTVGGQTVDRPVVLVSGVTLAGEAATIDHDGVHVAGQSAGQTQRSLAQQGLSIKLLGTSRADQAGAARSAAGGLEVTVSQPVSGAPTLPGLPGLDRVYVATVVFGGVGAVAAASSAPDLDVLLPPLPSGNDLLQHLTPPVAGRPAGWAGNVTEPLPGVAVPSAPQVLLPVVHVLPWDLGLVAAVLATVPPGLLLLWRLRVALARRPA